MRKLLLFLFVVMNAVPLSFEKVDLAKENSLISVEVKGYVAKPGVYQLSRGATVEHLLSLCQVFEDSELSVINLTQKLHDQDVLVIEKKTSSLISINAASLEQLMSLPGIGEATAKRIIEYRSEHPFQSLAQLMEVKGIGKKKYNDLIGLICL